MMSKLPYRDRAGDLDDGDLDGDLPPPDNRAPVGLAPPRDAEEADRGLDATSERVLGGLGVRGAVRDFDGEAFLKDESCTDAVNQAQAKRRASGTTSDCKHQSASDRHGRQVEHVTWRAQGGGGTTGAREGGGTAGWWWHSGRQVQ